MKRRKNMEDFISVSEIEMIRAKGGFVETQYQLVAPYGVTDPTLKRVVEPPYGMTNPYVVVAPYGVNPPG
jgi:hypothetical protein